MREPGSSDPDRLRKQAADCERLADRSVFAADREAFRRMAAEYRSLADAYAAEAARSGRSTPVAGPEDRSRGSGGGE